MQLAPARLSKATRYNVKKAKKAAGNGVQFGRVIPVLGFDSPPNADEFSGAVAEWQARHPPLKIDGKLGPNTWRRMRPLAKTIPVKPTLLPDWLKHARSPISPVAPSQLTGRGPEWLQIAQAELRRWELELATWEDSKLENPEEHTGWDEDYYQASRKWGKRIKGPTVTVPANADWCAAFVNWCLHRAGESHTGSAGAASFLTSQWKFRALEVPRPGCIVVCGNESGKATHVAFLWDVGGLPVKPNGSVKAGKQKTMLGGNQSGRVRIKSYTKQLLAARGEHGVKSPYLWPLESGGPSTCNYAPLSARGHYCGNPYSAEQLKEL